MEDREMVAAIVAGQKDGLAAAYDRYAPALYAYCRGLLGEPADAADVVQDTFIIAAGRLGGLRDPGRFRPWLYAVARNECRRLRSRLRPVPLDEAGEVSDDTLDLGEVAEQAELRALVGAALAGLNPGDREIIELGLRHELAGRDLADALGVSVNQAHALASRARSQFETSLGALLVARTGREACPELAAILDGWDGQLTVLLRKRINRHAGRCQACGDRRRHELSPAQLLALLPAAALLPAGLRDQLFGLIGNLSPVPSAYRAGVVSRAGPFGRSGFPRPLDPPHPVHSTVAHAATAGAGAAVVAVAAAGIIYGLHGPHGPRSPGPAAGPSTTPGLARPGPPWAAPRASAGAGSAAQRGTIGLLAGTGATASPGRLTPPPPATSQPVPALALPSATVTGTLAASATALTLHLGVTGSFTLTARGGPVSGIRIQNPDPLDLTISLGAGSLAAGQTATVRVTMVNLLGSSSVLIVSPGGLAITVNG